MNIIKRVAVLAICFIGYTLAAQTHEEDVTAKIIRSEFHQEPQGDYHWALETNNGIVSEARGKFDKQPDGNLTAHVEGSNSYVAPDGQKINWTYVADETGYHPVGDILPTTPTPMPIPDYIQRAIEYIAAKNKDKPT